MKPIGFIRTPFKEKNGCPRQAAILATSRATLRIDLPGGESYLDGLSQFSHVHLLFHFHLNDESSHIRPKGN
jgi:tRNA (Thr-GGU) A37 N-methylase